MKFSTLAIAALVSCAPALPQPDTAPIAAAESFLLAAAKTKGTRILDRWGPNLALAKALLERGRNQAVLEYFQLCKTFVTKNPKLDDWIALLKGGRAPDLSHEFLWHH